MAEQPALHRIHVIGYAANDRDFPTVALVADPRVAGYQVPKDLSACPDKRYPNHVFTGAQPIAGDQRVRHVWEILPSPWVPFTRYDDDLGPVQGRRRSVKNEGQVASREADKQVTYDAREGSAIVYTELEETWSIKTDEDGNSLFPVRDRDFYDASRGPVQERRQLFVPTGEEEGSLENVNGVITQTSYEPYNDFLSVKIVQTYRVDGPQLIGNATNSEGQLVTVTAQRKAAKNYIPPNPTATRTVEANREDAESLVERIVDTPQVFGAEVYRKTREDITPQKFKAAQEDATTEQNIEGAATPSFTLAAGEFVKSEQQINKFVKRVSTTSRNIQSSVILSEKVLSQEGQIGTRTLTLAVGDQTLTPSATLVDASVEALGDGRTVKTEVRVDRPFDAKQESLEKPEIIPLEFRASLQNKTISEIKAGQSVSVSSLSQDELSKTIQRITEHKIRETTITRPSSSYPSLSGQLVDNDLIKVVRTRTVAKGNQTITPSATVSGTVEALGDGYTLKTEDIKGKVFEAKTFSEERPDNIPVEFRVEKPASTEEYNEAGNASKVSLSNTEIAKSEQQVNEFVKRVRTTSRDDVGGVTLNEEQVDQDGVKVNVERSLVKGSQSIVPSATVRGQVQNLGGGYTVKTELTRGEIFAGLVYSTEKPDVVPAAFRATIETTTEEETVEGDAEIPVLEDGELSKTERQIDKFLKRKITVKRPETISGVLEGEQIENDGIKSTVTRTLSDQPQVIVPSATVSGNIEDIGDGLTIKTEIVKDKIFDSLTKSAQKPDTIPEKFRVTAPTRRTEEILEKVEAEEPELEDNEYSKTEQRLTEFTVQKTTVKREDAFNEVQNRRLEENWGIQIPFKEYIAQEIPDGDNYEGEGLDDKNHIVREYNKQDLDETLSSFIVTIPTSIDLDLPRVLEDIEVTWEESKSETESSTNVPDIMGSFKSLTQQDDGLLSSTLSVVPKIEVKFKDIWGKNLPAKIHLFFLKKEDLNDSQIRSKVGADENWPTFKPKSFIKTVYGKSETKELQVYVSRAMQVNDTTYGYGYQPSDGFRQKNEARLIPVSINIPPCISREFDIDEEKEIEFAAKEIELKYQQIFITTTNGTVLLPEVLIKKQLEHKLKVAVSININETTPKEIPTTGTYVISSSVEPYKFGWFLVRAVTLDASIFS